MITTVCLNPAIDQSAGVDQLKIGEVNRLRAIRSVIAGKGINVAIVLKRLGTGANCVCFVGGADVPFFARGMEREGVDFHAVQVPGSVRRNLKIIGSGDHSVTELNEAGAETNAEALQRLTNTLSAAAKNSRTVALCGSLPPGCGPDTYQTLMRTMPDKQWIVDTSGAALRQSLPGKPFLITPNLAELEEIVQARLTTPEAIRDAAVKLCEAGTAYVAVSLGERGAILTDGGKTVFAPAVPVTAVSAVGAGDAMLAGMLFGMERGETVFESLRYGVAAGAACAQCGSIHLFGKQDFLELLPKAKIQSL